MRQIEFYFEGKELTPGGDWNAGIKHLSGEPVDIAFQLGRYASAALKQLNQPQVAIIVINAYHELMRLNPDMSADIEKKLQGRNGVKILTPDNKEFRPPTDFMKKV
jgi:hypothetical protein